MACWTCQAIDAQPACLLQGPGAAAASALDARHHLAVKAPHFCLEGPELQHEELDARAVEIFHAACHGVVAADQTCGALGLRPMQAASAMCA
jgi:hypothetical protein